MEVIVRMIKMNPWSNVTKFPKCFDFVSTYWTRSGNLYTGMTAEEQSELEEALGYQEGRLAPWSPFWETFAVKIGKDDVVLDIDRPEDKLKYLFLKGHKRVANGLLNVTPATDYVLINKDSEAEESNKYGKVKREAYREMDKMSIEDMRKCLRLFGTKSDNISNALVEAKIAEIVEKDPQRFLSKWVANPDKELNFLLEEAVAKNIIRKNRTQYFYGTDMVGNSLEDAISYLKDKKNQDIKMTILQEIKSK